MAKRKGLSKGTRFDVFRRDGFTCQYCGRRPPDVVLEVDHITPVAEGGDNDEMNLVTACWDCNRGKKAKLLDKPQRPDADLEWLQCQQELAELRRYQALKAEYDITMREIVDDMQVDWVKCSGMRWYPPDGAIMSMLSNNPPESVSRALNIMAGHFRTGKFNTYGDNWLKYCHGILRRMEEERNAVDED